MHVKRVELSHFKSFGGTTQVPLLPGFTVISGPNGSGKSNILDALLFCLGLASSKGMRAERLPDLVNQNQASRRSTVEASVTATFDISDIPLELLNSEADDVPGLPQDEMLAEALPEETLLEGDLLEGDVVEGARSRGDNPGGNPLEDVHLADDSPDGNLSSDEPPVASGSGVDESGADTPAAEHSEIHHQPKAARVSDGQIVSQNGHGLLNGSGENGSGENGADVNEHPGDGLDENGKIVPLPREWSVTRRLRVTPQGTYTSNYAINGEPCTLSELHEQLQRFRIYPEGYNVVLQGDVTSIISMNSRERRGIIDELAGVASFDRKIDQAKNKLEVVRDREDRFRIVEQELIDQLERLDQDRKKAEKYQQLKVTRQEKLKWEAVLAWRAQQQQVTVLEGQLAEGKKSAEQLTQQMAGLSETIKTTAAALETLAAAVKALGEDEQIALQSKLATQEAELRQMVRRAEELRASTQSISEQLQSTQGAIQAQGQTLESLARSLKSLTEDELQKLLQARDQALKALEDSREATSAIASASQAWVQTQTELRHQIEAILSDLEPKRAERVRLQERIAQLQSQIETQQAATEALQAELSASQTGADGDLDTAQVGIQTQAQAVADAEKDLQTHRETQTRLLNEQREKQRELDKLEAQEQAYQETQGTQTAQVLERSNLSGICGLVAQLGRVDPKYQTALEIAAGARLGYLVVENDGVASRGIDILKRKRAGRATFLPLNAIRVPNFREIGKWDRPDGFIDYAVNLIECDAVYADVFAFVFGSTVVFETLGAARRHLGKFRMVTLDGEVLESSGAMTGGSLRRQGRLHFGTVEPAESAEAQQLRQRLTEIDKILASCNQTLAQAQAEVEAKSKALTEARQTYRERQLKAEQSQSQQQQLQQRLTQATQQLEQAQVEHTQATQRLQTLDQTLPEQETQLQIKRQELVNLEQSQTHSEWQQAQGQVRTLETQLNERQQALQSAQQQQKDLENQQLLVQEKIQTAHQQVEQMRQQQQAQINQQSALATEQAELKQQIVQTQGSLAELDKKLSTQKAERDRTEHQLRDQRNQYQQLEWQQQKLQEAQQERQQQLAELAQLIAAKRTELPDPLPEIPEDLTLEKLQQQLRSLQKRLEAMEPVNMLALEEYNRTQERLQELTDKLTTLEGERTELLLRIENFTTLRRRAFQEAFDAVNINFQAIFAQLSDGDGYLQLDDPQDPFNGGLNLVAHPKGKPVRRLASMSGGEKSLTALSFIFALQRYRPSPFYAFDEVDMFLDGANVERLSKMIRHQAQQAQFIVVSLRRPMIEASQRTIGVTQARGAYTQVLGIDLQRQSASV
ncbi:MAG: chromosome segregation protein SMC [Cyanobacteria bacterium P01_G01_bin.38]